MQVCANSKPTRRHHIVKRCLEAAARSVGLEVIDEPPVDHRPTNTRNSRADITIRGLGGYEVVIDFTVVHPACWNHRKCC